MSVIRALGACLSYVLRALKKGEGVVSYGRCVKLLEREGLVEVVEGEAYATARVSEEQMKMLRMMKLMTSVWSVVKMLERGAYARELKSNRKRVYEAIREMEKEGLVERREEVVEGERRELRVRYKLSEKGIEVKKRIERMLERM